MVPKELPEVVLKRNLMRLHKIDTKNASRNARPVPGLDQNTGAIWTGMQHESLRSKTLLHKPICAAPVGLHWENSLIITWLLLAHPICATASSKPCTSILLGNATIPTATSKPCWRRPRNCHCGLQGRRWPHQPPPSARDAGPSHRRVWHWNLKNWHNWWSSQHPKTGTIYDYKSHRHLSKKKLVIILPLRNVCCQSWTPCIGWLECPRGRPLSTGPNARWWSGQTQTGRLETPPQNRGFRWHWWFIGNAGRSSVRMWIRDLSKSWQDI